MRDVVVIVRPFIARSVALWIVLVAVLAAACGRAPDSGPPHGGVGKGDHSGGHKAEAHLHAAASLTLVLGEIAKEFEPIRGSHVVANLGASSALAQQIREGATPGVFVSASTEWADQVEAWGLAEPGTRVDLLSNTLVVIVPKDAAARPATLEDLGDARFARIAVADPAAVPAGKYARAAMERAGVFESVRARLVAAPDVRAALTYVECGEAQAGVVYATDAASSAQVAVAFRVPPDLHPRIVYPMLLVKGANRRSRELYDFLRSDAAWRAFERAGFAKP